MRIASLSTIWDAFRTGHKTQEAVAELQHLRLAEVVEFARLNSPYYRDLYKGLPKRIDVPTLLPITKKNELMERFDDWTTDRNVTFESARAFADNPSNIGKSYLGKYTLATTSGTTGTPGIFLLDDKTMAVVSALSLRMLRAWFTVSDVLRVLSLRKPMVNIVATGGHFAGVVAAAQHPRYIRVLPVDLPLRELVAQLNDLQPTILGGYATTISLLATEQEARRLSLKPVLVLPIAEGLPPDEHHRIAKAFSSKVRTSYAATECPFLSYSCAHGWLHVNSDWVLLEPVDADYRPTPPGQKSHTVLISNLANYLQPILRYDLGDAVLQRSTPCPCGSPLPAIRVQGRVADTMTFTDRRGNSIHIPSLALELDHIPGVKLLQIVQQSPTTLVVRMLPESENEKNRVWDEVRNQLTRLLSQHELGHVAIELAHEPPQQSTGGKYHTVIPLKKPSDRSQRLSHLRVEP